MSSMQIVLIVFISFIAGTSLLCTVIAPAIVKGIENHNIKKLERDLKAKYGEDALRAS
ncbi:MAG: hypothetical protein MJ246_06425 [Clostridia bacterium]|nr:hypothetical protein [Clostridia bacterium]